VMMRVYSSVVIDKQIEGASAVSRRLNCRGVVAFVGTWTSRQAGMSSDNGRYCEDCMCRRYKKTVAVLLNLAFELADRVMLRVPGSDSWPFQIQALNNGRTETIRK
jgi:hypothetical protein